MTKQRSKVMGEQKLYHGTRAAFRGSGGLVLPGNRYGKDNHNLNRNDCVYVTPDIDLAREYARACLGKNRARVLEVMPHQPVQVDDSTVNGEEQESFTCESATVVKVVWVEMLPAIPRSD